jgi:RNA polymerase sigma-70 factor (ECF subfamily)
MRSVVGRAAGVEPWPASHHLAGIEPAGVMDAELDGDRAASLRRSFAQTFATEADFRAFYDQALPRIYGYLHDRCGGDAAVAEELTQQTFVAAIRERSRFDGRSEPITWLIAIARHKLADHFRRLEREERRHFRLVAREIELGPDDRSWTDADQRSTVVRTLATLPALQRAVLVLHYADGLSIREMARELGKSESATESLMSRAREAFRRSYGAAADD